MIAASISCLLKLSMGKFYLIKMHVQSDLSLLLFVVGGHFLFLLASLLLALLAAFVRLLTVRLLVGFLLLLAGLNGIRHLQRKIARIQH
jgi:hypothetical protein